MESGTIHEMSRILGGLQSEIRTLTQQWSEREAAAVTDRHELRDKFDQMRGDFTSVEARVENLSKDVAEIKPDIQLFRTIRDQQIGAQRFGWKLWGALVAAAGAFGWIVHAYFAKP